MLYVLSVWLHVLAACVWVGGLLFFVLVIVPVVRRLDPPRAADVVRRVGLRFRPVGWGSLGLLIVTGTYNLFARWASWDALTRASFWLSPFGKTLGAKLALVVLILAATVAHDILGTRATARADRPEGALLRRVASWLGRGTTLLALAAVLLGVVLVRGWP